MDRRHVDNFFEPFSADLAPLSPDVPAKFDYLLERLGADGIRFGIMQGGQSTLLFSDTPMP